jgi:hypothetical protein
MPIEYRTLGERALARPRQNINFKMKNDKFQTITITIFIFNMFPIILFSQCMNITTNPLDDDVTETNLNDSKFNESRLNESGIKYR